jgi:carbamoyltransferase
MPDLDLGISAYYHDSSAAIVVDGELIAAAQEERFTRRRHDASFPANAVEYCLKETGVCLSDLSSVTYYEDSKLKFHRSLSSFASGGPSAFGAFIRIAPDWIVWKRNATAQIDRDLMQLGRGDAPKAKSISHHRSHAASAFYPSPFERAAVLCIDGVGEWQTTSIWRGFNEQLQLVNSISYPHSLGLLYSAFTAFCGFKVDSGEYKLMGLAPYGKPIYSDLIKDTLIHLRPDGSFTLNLDYFEFTRGERMTGSRFENLFGGASRTPEVALTQRECNIAASIQTVTDEAVIGLARAAREMTGESNLCLAGGVALNCVSNGHISRSNIFSRLWIQPAAGDAGCAVGAALDTAIVRRKHRERTKVDGMKGAYLGPRFSDDDVASFLAHGGHIARRLNEEDLLSETAAHLASGAVVGWFEGRMEFGPRALGARSILGDPRNTEMLRTMNLKIKYRESFRPFAPSVLQGDAGDYFDLTEESPYMLIVSQVGAKIRLNEPVARDIGSINDARSLLPAVTHVDLSARIQTVSAERSPRFAGLLQRFKDRTGYPVLVNTSFNVRGEPIVCTPQQAYQCFMRTEMDVLVLESHILIKHEQTSFSEDFDWRSEIPLD